MKTTVIMKECYITLIKAAWMFWEADAAFDLFIRRVACQETSRINDFDSDTFFSVILKMCEADALGVCHQGLMDQQSLMDCWSIKI